MPQPEFDAFISYSRVVDARLARALQGALQRFAKPWFRVRVLHVFRDDASLSANPGLWSSIVQALDLSSFLILLASPAAAASPWVEREIAQWRATKEANRILLVLTEGEAVWDETESDFDWQRTTALPHALERAFAEEPRWVDLRWARTEDHLAERDPRFREAVADLAAPIHGRPKDELIGEEVRQHRRTRRVVRGAAGVLATLTAVAVTLAVLAVRARNEARAQTRVALSKGLAAQALAQFDGRSDRALLLALEAWRLGRTAEARNALATVLERTERARDILVGSGSAVAVSSDGTLVAVGRSNGIVRVFRSSDDATVARFHSGGVVDGLTLSFDGRLLATSSFPQQALVRRTFGPETVRVWSIAGRVPRRIAGPVQIEPGPEVAFVPGRRLVAVDADSPHGSGMALWDFTHNRLERLPLAGHGDPGFPLSLSVSADGSLLAAASSRGLLLWNVASRRLTGYASGEFNDVALGTSGRLATLDAYGRISLWRARGRVERERSYATPIGARGLVWTGPATLMAVTKAGAQAFTIRQRSLHARVLLPHDLVRQFGLYSISRYGGAFVGSGDGALEVWNLEARPAFLRAQYSLRNRNEAIPRQLQPLADRVYEEAGPIDVRSPDGSFELTLDQYGGVPLMHTGSRHVLHLEPNAIDARFQPQGRLIAFSELNPSDIATDVPRLIVFRDAATWKMDGATILAAGSASSWIRELFFSPDGSLLATVLCHNYDCAHGETTRLWDVHTRAAIGPPLRGRGLGFSANGRQLVLFDDQADALIVLDDTIWTRDTERLTKRICTLVHRSLTREEWTSFVGSSQPYHRTCG